MGLCAAILILFHRDAADMAGIWWNSSTFTHCLLMVPMIGWLVVQRTPQLKTLAPAWWWPALVWLGGGGLVWLVRSEEHTSELQSLMRNSYAVFFLQKKKK